MTGKVGIELSNWRLPDAPYRVTSSSCILAPGTELAKLPKMSNRVADHSRPMGHWFGLPEPRPFLARL